MQPRMKLTSGIPTEGIEGAVAPSAPNGSLFLVEAITHPILSGTL